MREIAKKLFVIIAGEENRYKEEVDAGLYSCNYLQFESELNKKAKRSIEFIQRLTNTNLGVHFYDYFSRYQDVGFRGKVIIRPYVSLIEAFRDGVMGCYDVGYVAASITEEDGYLFAIKLPGYEDKAFGYVIYDNEGNIKKAVQAFNLDIKNKVILKYLRLFSRDILLPALKKKNEKTA